VSGGDGRPAALDEQDAWRLPKWSTGRGGPDTAPGAGASAGAGAGAGARAGERTYQELHATPSVVESEAPSERPPSVSSAQERLDGPPTPSGTCLYCPYTPYLLDRPYRPSPSAVRHAPVAG